MREGTTYSAADGPWGTTYGATDGPGGPIILPQMVRGGGGGGTTYGVTVPLWHMDRPEPIMLA